MTDTVIGSEVYIVQLFVKGGGIKPVPLEYFGEENLYLSNFPYFSAKIEHFLKIFEKLSKPQLNHNSIQPNITLSWVLFYFFI